jgi:hypothetical protein
MRTTRPGYSLSGLGDRLRRRFEITDRSMDDKMRELLDALMTVSLHREMTNKRPTSDQA